MSATSVDTAPTKARAVRVLIEGRPHEVNIEYIHPTSDGKLATEPLTAAWAARNQPEHFTAIREMVNSHYKRNKPGLTYFHGTGTLISHESRLEGLALLLLDWEGETTGISAQPFTLHFQRSRKPVSHTPDYFARQHDGTGVVIDVKSENYLDNMDVELQHALAEDIAHQSGWQYRVITDPTPTLAGNLYLLTGYRLTPHDHEVVFPLVAEALTSGPLPYGELKMTVAQSAGTHPALVAPHILHGLWTRELLTNIDDELTNSSLIASSRGVRR